MTMKQLAVKTVTLVLLGTCLQTFATSFDAPQYESASAINRPANDAAARRSYFCRNVKFNPRTQVCCFGRIYHKAHGHATQCCRRGVYNHYTMKCCRGKSIPKNHYCQPRRYKCGNTYYTNPKSVVCCNGDLRKRIYGWHTSCCRLGVYNTRSQTCCFRAPIRQQLPVYRNRYSVHTRCCLNTLYDHRVQICCNEKVLKHKSHGSYIKCCGEAVYNRLTQICCSGRVLHRSSTTRCCGSQVYNITTHFCCWGTVRKHEREHGMFSRCCRRGNRYTVYDCRSHLCCNGAAAPRAGSSAAMCCGQQTYNSMMAKCCPGNKVVMKCGTCK